MIVQSLDGKPIKRPSSLLISLGARSLPSAGNKLPFRSEPVLGQLTIRAPECLRLSKMTLYQQEKEIPVNYSDGNYLL